MQDSTLVQSLNALKKSQDTLLIHVNSFSDKIDKLKPALWVSLLPLIGVIIGGLLALLAQYLIKRYEKKLANTNQALEYKHKIMIAIPVLESDMHELAYLRVDSMYQLNQAMVSTDPIEKKAAFDDHYNSYRYIQEYKNKIITSVAEIYSYFHAYFRLMNVTFATADAQCFETCIQNCLRLRKAEFYSNTHAADYTQVESDIKKLQQEYAENLTDIKVLATMVL